MLIGLYLKNFKCYQGTQFIPCFSKDTNGNFVSYLGGNGVGKSAVLEALDAFFSKKSPWYRNKDSKKGPTESFVAPVFLVPKNKDVPKEFLNFSLNLIKETRTTDIPDGYGLICIAKREDAVLSVYDGKKEIKELEGDPRLQKVYGYLLKNYQYVYIDAEVNIDEQARINSEVYELIIGSSIVTEVEKKFKEVDNKKELIDKLNLTLEKLIDSELTASLKQIDHNYSYGGSKGAMSKLTTNTLAKVSTEAFLYGRKLKFKNKQIDTLSSGQRRRAFLDFIIAIVKNKIIGGNKTFILAIDEPEISLDSSTKMQQFEKILEIVDKNVCVMITSHWYGWIPCTNLGRSILIDDKDNNKKEITVFDNSKFPFEKIPKYEMRMIFDFLTSLGAIAESNKTKKYIVCEGRSDLIYFEASLNDNSFKIIPVGKGRVKKISELFKNYFWKDNGPILKNIVFIIDTDPEHHESYELNGYLKRWSKNDDLKITLLGGSESSHNKCIIEDILESDIFLASLKQIFIDNEFIQKLSIKYPDYNGLDSFGMDRITARIFYNETKDRKIELANEYKRRLNQSVRSNKIKEIITSLFVI
jgi:ABC-type cobalamin/Fe3+-siderophores transport system ATPase subunit